MSNSPLVQEARQARVMVEAHIAALQDMLGQIGRLSAECAVQDLVAEALSRCQMLRQLGAGQGQMTAPLDRTVDLQIFERLMVLAGPSTAIELLDQVKADLQVISTNLQAGAGRLDWAMMRAECHTLVAVAGAVGATTLQAHAETLHTAAVATNVAVVIEVMPALSEGLDRLITFVSQERSARAHA
ncbi:MAG: hypothetical protein MUD11_13380 [Rhodobacteraceae bacterium]|jgi:HPt (histidine-containing phosphotransfer) domain-containing protein|nr:hypothetical protein [Paracoccaceae bacterium]